MSSPPRWHAALSFAVLGQVPDDLDESGRVDLPALLADLETRWPGGLAAIRSRLAARGVSRLPVQPLPEELTAGLPPAQLAAALTALTDLLGLAGPRRVAVSRPYDADERRLRSDVPPHHH